MYSRWLAGGVGRAAKPGASLVLPLPPPSPSLRPLNPSRWWLTPQGVGICMWGVGCWDVDWSWSCAALCCCCFLLFSSLLHYFAYLVDTKWGVYSSSWIRLPHLDLPPQRTPVNWGAVLLCTLSLVLCSKVGPVMGLLAAMFRKTQPLV